MKLAQQKDKEIQCQLQEAYAKADSANKAKSSFLFSMSHDIRTPMNAIIGFTDMLEKKQEDQNNIVKYAAHYICACLHIKKPDGTVDNQQQDNALHKLKGSRLSYKFYCVIDYKSNQTNIQKTKKCK